MKNETLEKYAEVILMYGLKLVKGEKVLLLFDEYGIELARMIAAKAYQYGAKDVRHIYNDSGLEAARYKYGSEEALTSFPQFEADYQRNSMLDGYHSINLLSFKGRAKGIEPEKIAQYQSARAKVMTEAKKLGMSNHVKWVLAPVASAEWAHMVYPNEPADSAIIHLWNDLLEVCRIKGDNPMMEWERHNKSLKQYTERLNSLTFQELHFVDEHTDLTVGLVDGHIWCGGENETKDGSKFLSNIPTEEVYTMPNKFKVSGHVKITRPFMLFGEQINDLVLYFDAGKVIKFETSGNRAVIESFLQTDEGSCFLGEIALVDKFSPINQFEYPFYQVLIDENACSHLALGNAYDENIQSAYKSKEAVGFNQSSVHLDFMIGSHSMSVTGTLRSGQKVQIMKEGTWAEF
jgi:aminopeptidase